MKSNLLGVILFFITITSFCFAEFLGDDVGVHQNPHSALAPMGASDKSTCLCESAIHDIDTKSEQGSLSLFTNPKTSPSPVTIK